MNNFLKIALACLAGMAAITAVAAEDEMRWYTNEMTCANVTVTVTVQSYCKNNDDVSTNSFCTMQKMILKSGDRKAIVKKNLLEKEPARNEFHALSTLRCVTGREDKNYLYMTLDNGGNCDDCEINAVMDLQGKWKRYDRKWFVSGAEKQEITKRSAGWFKAEAFYLNNKIEIK
jgi:hypothetical protein